MTFVMTLPFVPEPLQAEPDERLVFMAKHGRNDAFDELVRRHSPRVHAVVSRVVGKNQAHDVVQDAFIAAFRAISGFRAEAKFSTWLHRIAMNCCYAQLRRPNFAEDASQDLAVVGFELNDESRRGPSLEAERRDLASALDAALARIQPEFRETFVLIEYGGLDYAGAAEALGVQPGTIKSRMSRARAALREILEVQGYRP